MAIGALAGCLIIRDFSPVLAAAAGVSVIQDQTSAPGKSLVKTRAGLGL